MKRIKFLKNSVKLIVTLAAFMSCAAVFAFGKSENQENSMKGKIMNEKEFDKVNFFGKGELNSAYAKYFIGDSFLNPVSVKGGESPIHVANVTFEPGCRNNWHIHHATSGGGQVIICTAGSGWFQFEGEEAVSMEAGDIAYFPAGVKHWHGAKADSWFSHLAFELPGENTSNEWLEEVTDEEFMKLEK